MLATDVVLHDLELFVKLDELCEWSVEWFALYDGENLLANMQLTQQSIVPLIPGQFTWYSHVRHIIMEAFVIALHQSQSPELRTSTRSAWVHVVLLA